MERQSSSTAEGTEAYVSDAKIIRLAPLEEFRFEVRGGSTSTSLAGMTSSIASSLGVGGASSTQQILSSGTTSRDSTSSTPCILRLVSGKAECFGAELALDVPYTFNPLSNVAIFTWHGCELSLSGPFYGDYVAGDTPMPTYLNVHFALEQLRQAAERGGEGIDGPRVLVLGPSDVGKSSLCQILCNYAVKQGRTPLFVDLDCSQGSISMPGTLAATVIRRPIDVQEVLNATPALMGTSPLVYYYGYSSPLDKPKLYKLLIERLAASVQRKLSPDMDFLQGDDELSAPEQQHSADLGLKTSGCIINTSSAMCESNGLEHLHHIITHFAVSAVLIIGNERLYSELNRHYGDRLSLVKLAKSGGVVNRDKQFRRQQENQRIRQYFYGASSAWELNPHSSTVSFVEVAVRKVGEGSLAPSSALPIGMERKIQETRFVKIEPGDVLSHSIVAVSSANIPENTKLSAEEESNLMADSPAMGFVYISEVSGEKRKMTVLSPCPGKLPKPFLIMGACKWIETL